MSRTAEGSHQVPIGLPAPTPAFNEARDFLMLVKTYPTPSSKYGETVCCAAIDPAAGGSWRRIYPVNFRSLARREQFKKWQFINARFATTNRDPRPESIRIQQETIRSGRFLPAGTGWRERRTYTDPLVVQSVEALRLANLERRTSLGVIRPARIEDLLISRADGWDSTSELDFQQLRMDWEREGLPTTDLERLPYEFKYRFRCADEACTRPHEMVILDWEIAQAYRRWRSGYGEAGWRQALREKYLEELPGRELHLILGTHHRYGSWMIVGVFAIPYPKVVEQDHRLAGHRRGEQPSMTLPWIDLEAE